jgi:diaminopimelate epimerase
MATPSRATPFTKYEGLGNDFVVIEGSDEGALTTAEAVRLCDRRRGVGADGVLLLLPPRTAQAVARMKVINADGSVPEMCGNGLRCVALHLHTRHAAHCFEVETGAGLRTCEIDAAAAQVTIGMGRVRVLRPCLLAVDGETLEAWLADAGNPHAVLFGGPHSPKTREWLGPRIATHAAFPDGINVGFASVNDGGIDLVVWERGVGLTLACGTGACAAVAVGQERGLVAPGPVLVRLPGGVLTVNREALTGETTLRGPARPVFSGVFVPDA